MPKSAHTVHNTRTTTLDAKRIAAMAIVIANTARDKGEVTRHDLVAKGFSPNEIDRLGDQAGAIAANRAGGEL